MIYVENKDLVIPGEVLADDEYYSGRGTFKENGKICSSLMGLVSLRNKKIRVIPLKSKYVPKKGDVVIGNGKVGLLPSVNSDKNAINRMCVDLRQKVIS